MPLTTRSDDPRTLGNGKTHGRDQVRQLLVAPPRRASVRALTADRNGPCDAIGRHDAEGLRDLQRGPVGRSHGSRSRISTDPDCRMSTWRSSSAARQLRAGDPAYQAGPICQERFIWQRSPAVAPQRWVGGGATHTPVDGSFVQPRLRAPNWSSKGWPGRVPNWSPKGWPGRVLNWSPKGWPGRVLNWSPKGWPGRVLNCSPKSWPRGMKPNWSSNLNSSLMATPSGRSHRDSRAARPLARALSLAKGTDRSGSSEDRRGGGRPAAT